MILSRHGDRLTLDDLSKHVNCIAAIGSGKTATFISEMMRFALSEGVACVCVTAKPEDGDQYQAILDDCKAPSIRMTVGGKETLNAIGEAARRFPSAEVRQLFDATLEQRNRSSGYGGHNESYFVAMASIRLEAAVVLLLAAGEEVSFVNIERLRLETPTERDALKGDEWKATWAFSVYRRADQVQSTAVTDAQTHWLIDRPKEGEKTRAGIEGGIIQLASCFNAEPCRKVYGTESTFDLEEVTEDGVSLLMDTPALVWGQPAVFGMSMTLNVIARVCLQRKNPTQPVLLVIDEAPLFLSQEAVRWLSLGRSKLLWVCSAMQSVSTLIAQMGADERARVSADAALGNYGLTLYGINNDPITCTRMSDGIGKCRKRFRSSSVSSNGAMEMFGESRMSISSSTNEQESYDLPPDTLTRLNPGEFVLVARGKTFNATGKPWMICRFQLRR